MKADSVILGGKVITMNPSQPLAQGIAIKDGTIIAVDKEKEILNLVTPETRVLRMDGGTVTPGFIDCHVHLTQTGLDFNKIDLSKCKSIDELKKLVAGQAKKVKPGQLIMGAAYQDFAFQEKRPPNRQELDQVAPDNPVWLSRLDTHSGVLNSKGLELLQIPEGIEGIGLDENNQPNGLVFGEANNHVRGAINKTIDKETRRDALNKACEKMLSVGITTVHAFEGGSLFADEDADFVMDEAVNLPVNIRLFNQNADVESALEKGLPRIGGDILIDGTIGSRTAALSEAYHDDPLTTGILYFDQNELEDFVIEAHCKGLQIAVHAIGDAAIEQILNAYDKAQSVQYRENHRHRIEHYTLPGHSHIERSVNLGIVHSLQVSWCKEWALTEVTLPTRLGEDRTARAYPVGSIWLAGGRICGSSDSPIVPADPMAGIYGTLMHFRPEERLCRMAGLSFFTSQAAYSTFEENCRGRIAPGYKADLAILDGDFLEAPLEKLAEMPIKATIVDGEVRYQSKTS